MVKLVSINLENCYGIKKLEKEFSFEKTSLGRSKKVYAIYASNGTMKSSFAKTMDDIQNSNPTNDQRYPLRKTIRDVWDENGNDIDNKQIYVIHPFEDSFESDKLSSLLASKNLRSRYEKILIDIDAKKQFLLTSIGRHSRIRDNESSIVTTFCGKDIYESLEKIQQEIEELNKSDLSKIEYKEIFNEDVKTFLEIEENKKLLNEYIDIFDKLIEESKFLIKDVFSHNNASDISEYLKKNGFFDAEHKIILKSKGDDEPILKTINSEDEFNNWLDSEKQTILEDPELLAKFEQIDSVIRKKVKLKSFREFLENNKYIIPDLMDLDKLKRKLWLNYIKEEEKAYNQFLSDYKSGKNDIEIIISEAKKEKTQWEYVRDQFNNRFKLPFKVEIKNREDIILKGTEMPEREFIFDDCGDKCIINRTEAMKVLSQGEKKALYLMDVIFEIEAKKQETQETLFIIDDIADSFDYMNKYAIIEYLIDISKEDFFYEIILTHNFDFFRTLNSRFIDDKNCLIAEKSNSRISLKDAKDVKMPIKNWIGSLNNNEKYVIAIIPFIRNIIEYTKKTSDPDYDKLTSMLHIRNNSKRLKMIELEQILQNTLFNNNLTIMSREKNVYDAIINCTDNCFTEYNRNNNIDLASKIIMSIGIRLKTEEFMIKKINDPIFLQNINTNQTNALISRYKDDYKSETKCIGVLDRVNLMTSENIHLNSFMYEPLIDLSGDHLYKLYQDVLNLDNLHSQYHKNP